MNLDKLLKTFPEEIQRKLMLATMKDRYKILRDLRKQKAKDLSDPYRYYLCRSSNPSDGTYYVNYVFVENDNSYDKNYNDGLYDYDDYDLWRFLELEYQEIFENDRGDIDSLFEEMDELVDDFPNPFYY